MQSIDHMDEPLKILCLSPRTPPAVRPQAILLGKMIPEWLRQGLRPVILSYDNNGPWDVAAPLYTFPPFRAGRIVSHVPPLRDFFEYLWLRRTCRRILPLLEKHRIDVIFSFANPQISNVIGAMLKRRSGIPYVSNFSDPWLDNPLEKHNWFVKRRIARQERYAVENSDRVVVCNHVLRDLIMKKYPAAWSAKTTIVPHCYDPSDYPAVTKPHDGDFIFRYIGAFYQKRNPDPLLRAIRTLKDKQAAGGRKFRLELVGADLGYTNYSSGSLQESLRRFGVEDVVKVLPSVSYIESLGLMKTADCLIAIDADMPGSPFLPCKPIDYAGSGMPIVAITPDHSPTHWFLQNLGYRTFDYRHLDGLADHLADMMCGRVAVKPDYGFLKQFQVKETTAKLIAVFRQALKNRG